MLRSLFLSSERLYMYTCLVVPKTFQRPVLQLDCVSRNANRHVHITSSWAVLPKDHPQKKLAVKEGKERENVPVLDVDRDPNMDEVRPEAVFPTADTHSLVINGVRYDELPIMHIKSSHNNTILCLTKHTGVAVNLTSPGMEGFKNAKKGTNIAAQAAGISAGQKALGQGMSTVRVSVRGIGPGRLPAIKGLQMAGMNIVSITDVTRIQHSWMRPRKQRRL